MPTRVSGLKVRTWIRCNKNLKKYSHDKTKFHLHVGMQTCHIQRSFDIIKNFGMFGDSIGVHTALGISEKWQTDDIPYPAAPCRKSKKTYRGWHAYHRIHCHPCDGARPGTSFVAGLIERVAKGETLPGKEATLGVSCSEPRRLWQPVNCWQGARVSYSL